MIPLADQYVQDLERQSREKDAKIEDLERQLEGANQAFTQAAALWQNATHEAREEIKTLELQIADKEIAIVVLESLVNRHEAKIKILEEAISGPVF